MYSVLSVPGQKRDDFLRSLILFHHLKVDLKAFCFVECCGVKNLRCREAQLTIKPPEENTNSVSFLGSMDPESSQQL